MKKYFSLGLFSLIVGCGSTVNSPTNVTENPSPRPQPTATDINRDFVPQVNWRTFSKSLVGEAIEKKLVTIIFFTGGKACKFCTELEETAFRNACVADHMNTRFLPVRVNVFSPANEDEAQLLSEIFPDGEAVIPVVLIVSPDGEMLTKPLVGVFKGEPFCDVLKAVEELVYSPPQ